MSFLCYHILQLFERRAKVVKAREIKIWKDITPEMMSEEEAVFGSFFSFCVVKGRSHPFV